MQQQLGHDVSATLLATGLVERSGLNSPVLSTSSGSSSMLHAGHTTNPRWAIGHHTQEVQKRLENRCKICSTWSPSSKQERLGRSGETCQSSTSRAPQVAAKRCQEDFRLVNKSGTTRSRDQGFVQSDNERTKRPAGSTEGFGPKHIENPVQWVFRGNQTKSA